MQHTDLEVVVSLKNETQKNKVKMHSYTNVILVIVIREIGYLKVLS